MKRGMPAPFYFGTQAQFEAAQVERIKEEVKSYLSTLPPGTRAQVTAVCAKQLADRGINVPVHGYYVIEDPTRADMVVDHTQTCRNLPVTAYRGCHIFVVSAIIGAMILKKADSLSGACPRMPVHLSTAAALQRQLATNVECFRRQLFSQHIESKATLTFLHTVVHRSLAMRFPSWPMNNDSRITFERKVTSDLFIPACASPQEAVARGTALMVDELALAKNDKYLNAIGMSAQYFQSLESMSVSQRSASIPQLFGLNKMINESDFWNSVLGSEGLDVLKALYRCKESLSLLRDHLPRLMEFTNMLFEKCRAGLTRHEAAETSIGQFIRERVKEADQSYWLKKFARYAESFNKVWPLVTNYGCTQFFKDGKRLAEFDFIMNEDQKLAMLLPTTSDAGVNSQALLLYLANLQETFLALIQPHVGLPPLEKIEKLEKPLRISKNDCIKFSPDAVKPLLSLCFQRNLALSSRDSIEIIHLNQVETLLIRELSLKCSRRVSDHFDPICPYVVIYRYQEEAGSEMGFRNLKAGTVFVLPQPVQILLLEDLALLTSRPIAYGLFRS